MFEYIILKNEDRSVKKGIIDKTGANGKFYAVDTDGGKRRSRKRNQKKSKKNNKKRNPRKSRRHSR